MIHYQNVDMSKNNFLGEERGGQKVGGALSGVLQGNVDAELTGAGPSPPPPHTPHSISYSVLSSS
jgi:hypothetical protein